MITSDASVIERAADLGINYFDTARGYPERQQRAHGGRGAEEQAQEPGASPPRRTRADKAEALADLDTSLKELGTDYVDIWYLHAQEQGRADHRRADSKPSRTPRRPARSASPASARTAARTDVIPAVIKNPKIDVILAAYNFTMDQKIERRHRGGGQGRRGRRGHEGDGGRLPPRQAGRQALQHAQEGRRHGGGAEVGAQQSERRHHHPQHDRHGPARREPEGHVGAASATADEKILAAAARVHPAALLPHVRRVRRHLPARACRWPTCCAS